MKQFMPSNLIAGALFTMFALPLAIPVLFAAYNPKSEIGSKMKNTHIRQLGSNNENSRNEADLGDKTPTIEQKLDAALVEITRLTKAHDELKDKVGDFVPEGQVMIPLENYQLLQEILREHNAIMPMLVVHEASTLKLLDKDNLKEYKAEQVLKIDEAFTTPDDILHSYMDSWIKRNPEFGFTFEFVKTDIKKAS